MDKELVNTFCELVKIPSPSRNELAVSKYIKNYLKRIGIASYSDSVGKLIGSNTGNIIAKIGKGKPRIMFVAHMDTVEDGKNPIKPIIAKDIIRSNGKTILGSDDKAGVAALLEAIKELREENNLPTFLAVFSINEEGSPMGVNYLKADKGIDYVFDIDGSDAPGKFVNKALGYTKFEMQIFGKEAHAARNPEKGRNAIRTAAMIISNLSLGKDSNGGTMNVGRIEGGNLPNVIPGYSSFIGEARAYSKSRINKKLSSLEVAAKKACKETGCKYRIIKVKNGTPPFSISPDSKIVKLAKKASQASGIKFSLLSLSATIQGNMLAAKGYNVLGLCKGGRMAHSKEEYLSIKELEKTKILIIKIVKLSENA